jgi:hypothetical protein
MNLFELIFPACMLLFPWTFVQFFRPQERVTVDLSRIRRLRLRLHLATAVVLISFFALYALRQAGSMEWWANLPKIVHLGAAADQLMWTLFFPLFFALAMPLMVASRPEMNSPHADQTGQPRQLRSASLVSRAPVSVLPKHALLYLIGLWILGASVVAALIGTGHAEIQAENPKYWLSVVIGLGCALLPPLLLPVIQRSLAREPEPMDSGNSVELAKAYQAYRATRERGFFYGTLLMELVPLSLAIIPLCASVDGGMVGLVGGGAGALIGIAGAAFGVSMGMRRMGIARLLNELEESRNQTL